MRKDLADIKCSLQVALIGYITPNLRSVCVNIDENKKVTLIFYYDDEPSEDERELASLADTEFISDFPFPEFETENKVFVLPYPKPIPRSTSIIYKRYEENYTSDLLGNPQFSFENMKTDQGKIICALQEVLIGKVTENLRAITNDFINGIEFFNFYYDKEPNQKEKELFYNSERQFRNLLNIKSQFKMNTLAYPNRCPQYNKAIYARYEDSSKLV